MALRLEDVRAYYAATFRPDLTTIVVVGDVSAEQARRVVSDTFGTWQATGATPGIDLPQVAPSKSSRTRVPDSDSLQDRVTLAETLTLPVTSPDRYSLMLGNVILGSGFTSRLVSRSPHPSMGVRMLLWAAIWTGLAHVPTTVYHLAPTQRTLKKPAN